MTKRELVMDRGRTQSTLRKIARKLLCGLGILLLAGATSSFAAEPGTEDKTDFSKLSLEELLKVDITPINVLGSHTHLAGEFMFGYRMTYQRWEGDLQGSREVDMMEVLDRYPVHHTFMDMYMHMFDVMYAPSDRWTVMAMTEYMEMNMGHMRRNGMMFTTHSEGIGDTEVTGLYNVLGDPRDGRHRLLINGGLSLPTGSIDKSFNGSQLEYMMQLGSGTFDFKPGLTYLGHADPWSWGAQAAGTIRVGENDRDYRLGDAYRLDTWGHYKVTEWFGPSLRMEWNQWGDIHGADTALNRLANPAFDPDLQQGRRLDFLGGLHFYAHKGRLKGLRFSAEGGAPIYQYLAGPNLKTDWLVTFSLSYVIR
jgi:hypothetical protein